MYITDLRDLYVKARKHLGRSGKCLSMSSKEQYVRIALYDSEVFRLLMPQHPYTSFSFVYDAADGVSIQNFLGTDLAFVENTEADFEAAFKAIDRYCRLRLPDKFLEAYDAL